MAEWLIFTREVWIQGMTVEADTLAEAVEMVRDDDGDEHSLEYSRTMDVDTWTAMGPEGHYYENLDL